MSKLGLEPVARGKLNQKGLTSLLVSRIKSMTNMAVAVAARCGVPVELQFADPNDSNKSPYVGMHTVVPLLKEKFTNAGFREKAQILTVLPLQWSKRFISGEFSASEKIIRTARALQTEKGILALPEKKTVKRVQDTVVENVLKFYFDDENSGCLPGMYDFVKVNSQLKQKRLLLHKMKDLYKYFVQSYSENLEATKIGISKFCMLRPKEIRLAVSKGMHNFCVCTIHENVRFQTRLTSDCETCGQRNKEPELRALIDSEIHRLPRHEGRNNKGRTN
jgi:hypothetical protein